MAVSLAVVALAGCGHDEPAARATATAPPTVPMSAPPETFIRNVNEICSAMREQLDALPRPSSLRQVPGVAVKEIAIRRAAIGRLASLDAPAVLRAEAAALARDLRAQQRRARAVGDRARGRGRGPARAQARHGGRLQRVRRALEEGQHPAPGVGAGVGVLVVAAVEERVRRARVGDDLVLHAGS